MKSTSFSEMDIWFVTGSQSLYGEYALSEVDKHSKAIVNELNKSEEICVPINWKPVVVDSKSIAGIMEEANRAESCIGVITWMHTFSPAKMWIRGLTLLNKPLLHFHTQYNRDIPWETIDMDFMNLNQSAHGDKEYGFICSRLGIHRRVIAGHWQNKEVQKEIGSWMRAAVGRNEASTLGVARFGDNMRNVAVTDGDKVGLHASMGIHVDGYGVGDLVDVVSNVSRNEVNHIVEEYKERYLISEEILHNSDALESLAGQAKLEVGLRRFLETNGYRAFTTTFEDLHGLPQLPGLAVQRLMEEGYGFGAEGDWKHAALVRIMKSMANGLQGGTSFMEDYTYHLEPNNEMVLGAHMLEVCPSIAIKSSKPRIEVHPLDIGGKEAPARMVFDGAGGEAVNVSLVDMGDRLRMIVHKVEAFQPEKQMPNLPVARVLWKPKPDFKTAIEGWILAGGAHHTCFSTALSFSELVDFATVAGIELVSINEETTMKELKRDLLLNEQVSHFRGNRK